MQKLPARITKLRANRDRGWFLSLTHTPIPHSLSICHDWCCRFCIGAFLHINKSSSAGARSTSKELGKYAVPEYIRSFMSMYLCLQSGNTTGELLAKTYFREPHSRAGNAPKCTNDTREIGLLPGDLLLLPTTDFETGTSNKVQRVCRHRTLGKPRSQNVHRLRRVPSLIVECSVESNMFKSLVCAKRGRNSIARVILAF